MQWWRDAVFYQVYVPSFTDSDGDGLGDLQGVRSRLGYLELLGVDALWLSPIYPSPMVDNGYDITDHRAVDRVWLGTRSTVTRMPCACASATSSSTASRSPHTGSTARWSVMS